MNNLYIFTLATSNYNLYLPYLFKSLINFKINNKFHLKLVVISDVKPDFNEVSDNIESYHYYPTPYLPYPFNTYLKLFYINHAIDYFNISIKDYMIFIDADTIFRDCNNFDFFINSLYTNKMIFSISNYCNYKDKTEKDEYDVIYMENYDNVLSNYYIENLDYHKYIQSSFLAGNIKTFKKFADDCFKFIENDHHYTYNIKHRKKIIPSLNEQSLINKIISYNYDNYILDYFHFNLYKDLEDYDNYKFNDEVLDKFGSIFAINDYPNIFLIQKYNPKIKDNIILNLY